jgi:hypothetical protein
MELRMPIRDCQQGIHIVNRLFEDYYGGSTESLWYSGISSCVTINLQSTFGFNNFAYTGFHSTVGDTTDEFNQGLDGLNKYMALFGTNYVRSSAYIVGSITNYISWPPASGLNSVSKIAQLIKQRCPSVINVYYYDFSKGKPGDTKTYNLFTEKDNDSPFSYLTPANDSYIANQWQDGKKPAGTIPIPMSSLMVTK